MEPGNSSAYREQYRRWNDVRLQPVGELELSALPPHEILNLLAHRRGAAPVVRQHGQRVSRIEVHQEVGADAGETAAVAHGAAERTLVGPKRPGIAGS